MGRHNDRYIESVLLRLGIAIDITIDYDIYGASHRYRYIQKIYGIALPSRKPRVYRYARQDYVSRDVVILTLFVLLVSSVHIAIDSSVSAVPGSVRPRCFPISMSTFEVGLVDPPRSRFPSRHIPDGMRLIRTRNAYVNALRNHVDDQSDGRPAQITNYRYLNRLYYTLHHQTGCIQYSTYHHMTLHNNNYRT